MIYKNLTGTIIIATISLFSQFASAATYEYSRTFTGRAMESYSSSWNEDTEVLSLSGTWDSSANIDQVQFLLSDGGSPHLNAGTEQFLFYDVDLVNNTVGVYTYFGRTLIQSYNNILNIQDNGFSFSLGHELLNNLNFDPLIFNGAGFAEDIGIWYYLRYAGSLIDTYDVHHGETVKTDNPSSVPEPTTIVLLALGLLGLTTRKFGKSSELTTFSSETV
jgi:hypothetical protein